MVRSAVPIDAFNAIADERRRDILGLLAERDRPVQEVVDAMGMAQPLVSKHLKVLRDVGLVDVEKRGRMRVYRLSGDPLKSVHDWVGQFERFWDDRLDRIKRRAERSHNNDLPQKGE